MTFDPEVLATAQLLEPVHDTVAWLVDALADVVRQGHEAGELSGPVRSIPVRSPRQLPRPCRAAMSWPVRRPTRAPSTPPSQGPQPGQGSETCTVLHLSGGSTGVAAVA